MFTHEARGPLNAEFGFFPPLSGAEMDIPWTPPLHVCVCESRRRTLHQLAARALIEANQAVARHFTEAGLNDLALEWWGKAGDQALRRSAFQEAIADLGIFKSLSYAES
jgi:hypothetical protein